MLPSSSYGIARESGESQLALSLSPPSSWRLERTTQWNSRRSTPPPSYYSCTSWITNPCLPNTRTVLSPGRNHGWRDGHQGQGRDQWGGGMEQRTMLRGASMPLTDWLDYWPLDMEFGVGEGGDTLGLDTSVYTYEGSEIRHALSLPPPLSTIIVARFSLVNTNTDNNI